MLRSLFVPLQVKDAQTREDELILYCQAVNHDPSFATTAQVLRNSALQVQRSPEEVRARYEQLRQSGRAQVLMQGPSLSGAIAKFAANLKAGSATK